MNEQPDDKPESQSEPGAEPRAEATPLDTPTAAVPEQPPEAGFNPLINESDMFKVLVGVVILAAAVISLALIGRAVF